MGVEWGGHGHQLRLAYLLLVLTTLATLAVVWETEHDSPTHHCTPDLECTRSPEEP